MLTRHFDINLFLVILQSEDFDYEKEPPDSIRTDPVYSACFNFL